MEKLENVAQLFVWSCRKLLGRPPKTIAPVLWRPSKLTKNHMPSKHFRQENAEIHEKIEMIIRELTVFSKLVTRFPQKIRDKEWEVLVELPTRKTRYDQLNFWYRKEVMAEEERLAKANIVRKPSVPKLDTVPLARPSSNCEEWQKHRRLVTTFTTQSSPILAIDCQFLPHLSPRGRSLTAMQLQYLAAENRQVTHPFRMYFINYPSGNAKVEQLEKTKLVWLKNRNCINPIVSEKGIEVFGSPKKVIYLSPDAPEELETVDDDSVYILGGIVDRVVEHGISKNASLDAAQKAGVSARKLPIDKYIEFKSGSRFLTLLAVAECLREVNVHGDWRRALRKAVPVRNTRGVQEKNPKARAAKQRIVEFNLEVLRRTQRILGDSK